ncbi:MAG: C4-dicarboxylate ABC transporter substrate-binding protein [Deltaproteobacteria bacterium]|nr:MAG: C4-dicarboxylate ABC transporter substrate-binding protein [Deltaproteobacteria bacterium]
MRKKIALLVAGVFLASIFSLTLIPGQANAKTIRLSYAQFAPAKTFVGVQLERWKKEVEKRTNGKVKVDAFHGGTLLGAKNMMDGVIAGTADIGCLCMAYQPGRFLITNATSLPLGFPNARVASLTLWDLYNKYKPKAFSKVKVLTMFTCGPSNIMSKVPVRTLADLKGLDLRASGGAAKILKAWGANQIGMPMSAVPEALQKGVVKGLFSSLEVMKDFRFAEICKYVTITNTVIYPFAVVMNPDVWNSLPGDVQKVMDSMAKEHAEWTGSYMDRHIMEAIEWSKKEEGVEVIHLSKEKKAKWDKLLEPITSGWIKNANKKGLPGEAIVSDIKAFMKKYE